MAISSRPQALGVKDSLTVPRTTTDNEAPRPPTSMRSDRRLAIGQVLAIALSASLVGSAASLGVAHATGWGNRTVVERYVANTSDINTRPSDIQGILARILPSVVSITAVSTRPSPFFFPGYGSTTTTASGTGVVVTRDGEVVTNDHVIAGATSVTVTLNGSSEGLKARILGASEGSDLALLKIDSRVDLIPATFGDSTKTLVGDQVLAVGYALGLSGGPTVTDGIISAVGRQVATETSNGTRAILNGMLQTDAAISSGNSGGPLVDSSARVVGINTAVATSSSTATAQNIGFAIPSHTVEVLLSRLRGG
jgi:S1-C subfamily serine protease